LKKAAKASQRFEVLFGVYIRERERNSQSLVEEDGPPTVAGMRERGEGWKGCEGTLESYRSREE